GAVTSSTGVVEFSSNLKWNKMPVGKILSEQLGMPVKVCNDANVATYGEAIYGAGKKYNTVIMLTLGTGVGGGIVIDKKLYEGNGSKAGEVGHTTLVLGGEKCNCGRSGCCEAYVSASALIRDTKRAMLEDDKSLMWQVAKSLDGVDGTTACECAKLGDKTAIKVYDNYANYLAETIMNFCNIFRPEAIILGGGISNHGKFLFEKVRKICKKNYYGYKGTPEVKIVCARLKNDAGVIGAAIL
ncbi:MAG: ROK family protein, partial [Clostridiales bacterium]|nr:ROK family protein [Clostridiales bacterium]